VRAGAPADPTEDIIVAADQLARAVARATPEELAAAEVQLASRTQQLALPSGDRPDHTAPPAMLRAVRAALTPRALPPPRAPSTAQLVRDRVRAGIEALARRASARWPRAAALLATR